MKMLYNIYRQNTPSVVAKGKPSHTRMFEADLQSVDTIYVERGCPFDAAKAKGHVNPVVECVNGYHPETGKPLK
jgi:hypothetical protein